MAHNLTIRADGMVEMAYVGASPWHRLGNNVKLEGGRLATSTEMQQAAGIDWTVEPRDLKYSKLTDTGIIDVTLDSHVVNVRADTQEPLGIVGKDYKILQNREGFELMDGIVGEAAAMYDTAGSLRGGKRVWVLAKLPKELVVTGDDILRQMLLLILDHAGDGAAMVGFATERAVCENTVNANLSSWERGVSNMVRMRHAGDMRAKVEEARRVLNLSLRYFEVAGASFRAMSAVQINDLILSEYLKAVMPLPKEPEGLAAASDLTQARFKLEQEKSRAIHLTLAHLFEHGAGQSLPGAKGTVWGAYNAVTEWIDHVRPAKRDGVERKGGAEAALFGEGASIRQRAFDEAIALLK